MCVMISYGHFYVEHNRGHHKLVATDEDPATARYSSRLLPCLPLPSCLIRRGPAEGSAFRAHHRATRHATASRYLPLEAYGVFRSMLRRPRHTTAQHTVVSLQNKFQEAFFVCCLFGFHCGGG